MDTKLIVGIIVAAVIILAIIVAVVSINRARRGRDVQDVASPAELSKDFDQSDSVRSDATEPGPRLEPVSAQVLDPTAALGPSGEEHRDHLDADGSPSALRDAATHPAAASQLQKPESSSSRLIRLRSRLAKSSNPFGKVLFTILTKDQLTESDWEEVEDTLLLADVGAQASGQLVDELRSDARVTGQKNPAEIRELLRTKLLELVDIGQDRALKAGRSGAVKPSVIMMVGVNGTGKTTTAGKLARLFVAESKTVVMGAADTFRAAAADQLQTWGNNVNVPVVRSDKDGADPASVAFEAAQRAVHDAADVLIIDTAGRLQNKANLMDELGKIRRVTEKTVPVDEVLLVLDATTGQNGMAQAKVFAEAIGITGIVLSKMDGSAKGGIVISVQRELGVPVKLVGLGEGPDDLAPFDPETFVDGILAES
jgi:fused signal recognition particle receptor